MSEALPIKLGVNIDHVATLREARGGLEPDVLEAAKLAVDNGADFITVHLREDRRHIQDHDVNKLIQINGLILNLEMAATNEMISIAESIKPTYCCIVPEKRKELTTEGGLNVIGLKDKLKSACTRLNAADIIVSLFVDPDLSQIEAAKATGAKVIEIHTGHYANAKNQQIELQKISAAAEYANELGLQVNAGHGLTIDNVSSIACIPQLAELNIGHSIVSRAIFIGLDAAVNEIKSIIQQARS